MTNGPARKTKNIDESYTLQYGVPALANGVVWDRWSSRVSVCAERMVVVFEASNETSRRDDAGVGLLRWRQGVPVLGDSTEEFQTYVDGLERGAFQEEDARMLAKKASQEGDGRGGKKKVQPSKGASSDIGRGRDLAAVRAVVKGCAREAADLGLRGAIVACQALDDAYWAGSPETPRVLGAAWSPPYMGGDGGLGSMMAVCFDDGSLMLFSKPKNMTAFWVPEINLSRAHKDVPDYEATKKKHVVRDVVLPGSFMGVAWSDSFQVAGQRSGTTYSLIAGITELGVLELYRVTHLTLGDPASAGVESRVAHVGTVRLGGECITQATFVMSRGTGDGKDVSENDAEIVVVCGCESGAVTACTMTASQLVALDTLTPGIESTHVDLVGEKKASITPLIPSDDRIVTSLATCVCSASPSSQPESSDRQVIVAVGKTAGNIQVFLGERASSSAASLRGGKQATVPAAARPDMHSISGLAFLMDGQFLVASSRLGNLVTLRVPDMELHSNPVHHTMGGNNLQYAGFGCYGLATSPGGAFVAIAKQSQEPDREFRMQQQIHQMVTQGYLHIQSVAGIGPKTLDDAEGPAPEDDVDMTDADVDTRSHEIQKMCDTLVSLVIGWAHGSAPASALWDAGRTAALLENLVPPEKMVELLLTLQKEAGVHLAGTAGTAGTPSPCTLDDHGHRTYRFAAAMLHVIRSLQGDYLQQIISLGDWEMISMKGHIASILAKAKTDVKKTASDKLTGLLAIDFVVAAHKSHPWIFPQDFERQATALYAEFEGAAAPAAGRPISVDLDAKFVAPITTTSDGRVASMDRAIQATVVDSSGALNEPFEVMRCPASLQGNLDGGGWICASCKRSYSAPPQPSHLGLAHGVVACTLCASTKICADIPYHT